MILILVKKVQDFPKGLMVCLHCPTTISLPIPMSYVMCKGYTGIDSNGDTNAKSQ